MCQYCKIFSYIFSRTIDVQNDFRCFQDKCFTFLGGFLLTFARNENKQVKTNIKQTILFTLVNVSVAHVLAVLEEA